MNKQFQQWFKRFLRERGLTKAEAARRAEFAVSKATLGNWEDGIPPRPENLDRFLGFYPDADRDAAFQALLGHVPA